MLLPLSSSRVYHYHRDMCNCYRYRHYCYCHTYCYRHSCCCYCCHCYCYYCYCCCCYQYRYHVDINIMISLSNYYHNYHHSLSFFNCCHYHSLNLCVWLKWSFCRIQWSAVVALSSGVILHSSLYWIIQNIYQVVWAHKIRPYLALTGELWAAFCWEFGETWPRYNCTAFYIKLQISF